MYARICKYAFMYVCVHCSLLPINIIDFARLLVAASFNIGQKLSALVHEVFGVEPCVYMYVHMNACVYVYYTSILY